MGHYCEFTIGGRLNFKPAHWIVPIGAAAMLLPQVSAGMALLAGIVVAVGFGNPFVQFTRAWTHRLLAVSVVGLGAGMDLNVVGRVGLHGIGYTLLGIAFALSVGTVLARLLKVNGDTGLLIAVGTAICGGSAIAAVAPVIRAKSSEVSVALGTVFMLNALALITFPSIGHYLDLSQAQFGLWSALAIHDTSSVVGATLQYGAESLQVGTTIKLARALWIVPVALAVGVWHTRTHQTDTGAPKTKAKRPWFILGFLLTAALVTYVPALQSAGHMVEAGAKRALVLTLFLIGCNLTKDALRTVGLRPFIQGVTLWILVASATLAAITTGLIR